MVNIINKVNEIDKFIMIIGLEGSGRRTLSKLLNKTLEEYEIEYVRKIYKFSYNSINFQIFTAGMQTRYIKEPNLWNNYCTQCQGIIYVFDSSYTLSFKEASDELSWLVNQELLANKPLLIFANKKDSSIYLLEEISEILNVKLIKNRKLKLVFSSAVLNTGINEGISWILNNIS